MKKFFPNPIRREGFTLLEVMISIGIFFMATFAILAMISNGLSNARRLQRPMVDAGMIAAQISLTNQLTEGTYSGNVGDLLGQAYSDYIWSGEIVEIQTNRLFQANVVVQRNSGDKPVVSQMSVQFFRPQSPAGSLDGATTAR